MENKILVTGGYGLVGSEFIKPNFIPLSSSEADLRVRKDIDNILESINFVGVIHCAGKVGGLGGNMKNKGQFFYDNIMINTNVIESARTNGIKNLVSFLSTCIFPNDVDRNDTKFLIPFVLAIFTDQMIITTLLMVTFYHH